MLHLLKNALKEPSIFPEAANWLFTRHVLRSEPTREHYGVQIGSFVDFSEYHTFRATIAPEEHAFLKDFDIGPGAVLDIGANLGMFSCLVAQLRPGRRILAFEPGPSTFPALQSSVRRNGANVECHRLALSDRDGEVAFAMRENARANSSISTDGEGVRVPTRTLDSVVAEFGIAEIGLLKIDTEGFETPVLQGATRVLNEIRPSVIYFEVCPTLTRRAGFDPSGPAQILADAGYALRELRLDGSLGPVTPELAQGQELANWVALARA